MSTAKQGRWMSEEGQMRVKIKERWLDGRKRQVMLLKLVPKKHNRSALAFVAVGHRSVG